jgi:hypothetical protein
MQHRTGAGRQTRVDARRRFQCAVDALGGLGGEGRPCLGAQRERHVEPVAAGDAAGDVERHGLGARPARQAGFQASFLIETLKPRGGSIMAESQIKAAARTLRGGDRIERGWHKIHGVMLAAAARCRQGDK